MSLQSTVRPLEHASSCDHRHYDKVPDHLDYTPHAPSVHSRPVDCLSPRPPWMGRGGEASVAQAVSHVEDVKVPFHEPHLRVLRPGDRALRPQPPNCRHRQSRRKRPIVHSW